MTAKEFDETVHRLEEGDSLSVNGLVGDGVFLLVSQLGWQEKG